MEAVSEQYLPSRIVISLYRTSFKLRLEMLCILCMDQCIKTQAYVQWRIQDFSKEGRGAVFVERGRVCWRGLGPSRKKNYICPQNDKFRCILTQVLKARKHGQSLEALRHGFYGSIAKRSLQNSVKLSKYSLSNQKEGGLLHHRPLNTPLPTSFLSRAILIQHHYM